MRLFTRGKAGNKTRGFWPPVPHHRLFQAIVQTWFEPNCLFARISSSYPSAFGCFFIPCFAQRGDHVLV